MTARVLIHVQHLWGIGHLQRVAAIGHALVARGADLHVASGGPPVPGLDLPGRVHLLPPVVAADASFSALVTPDGQAVDAAWRAARRERLLAILAAVDPAVVVIETWPFGRRQLAFELEPLIAAVASKVPRPALLCSIRDVPEPKRKPGREAEIVAQIQARFDGVLVHGDAALVPFQAGFAAADQIAGALRFTGYVVDPARRRLAPPADQGYGEVIVAAGGGRDGALLLSQALAARAAGAAADRPWRLLLGPALPPGARQAVQAEVDALAARGGAPVRVEPNRPDYPGLLTRAALSLSQAGYNTVTEILASDTPALLIPRGGHELEQQLRARALAGRVPALRVADAVTPADVAALLAGPRRPAIAVDLNGAARSAHLILGFAALPRETPTAAGGA